MASDGVRGSAHAVFHVRGASGQIRWRKLYVDDEAGNNEKSSSDSGGKKKKKKGPKEKNRNSNDGEYSDVTAVSTESTNQEHTPSLGLPGPGLTLVPANQSLPHHYYSPYPVPVSSTWESFGYFGFCFLNIINLK